MKKLSGRVALVTGSTSGIGLGIAKALAGAGADIVLTGFGDADVIERERKGFEDKFGVKAWYVPADLSKSDEARKLVDDAVKVAGKVDILINDAGIQHTAPVESFPQEMWDKIMAIMLTAPFAAISQVLPVMRKNGWGRIVNISSAHGLVASTHKAAYVSAKHGLLGLTKVVALETAKEPITCNAICPGWVKTPLVDKQIEDMAKRDGISVDAAKDKLLLEKQPSGEFATPEELGALAVFLCSDDAKQCRGGAYVMDGGWTVQ